MASAVPQQVGVAAVKALAYVLRMVPLHKSQALKFLEGGREFFPVLIQAIDAAKTWVQLETYIFGEVAEALIRADQRGIIMQVLVDGISSAPLPAESEQKVKATHVQWFVYSPLVAEAGGLGLLPDP